MTDLEKRANIEDKQRFYDEAKRVALEASERARQAEQLAMVERAHANKMGERQNAALRELQAAKASR